MNKGCNGYLSAYPGHIYNLAKNKELNFEHIIKKPSDYYDGKYNRVNLYTDGCCKGGNLNYDGKGFSGHGSFSEIHQSNGEVKNFTQSGGLFNATSDEAELTAVISGLKGLKGRNDITIYTDSAYVVNCLKDRSVFEKEIEKIKQKPFKDLSTYDRKIKKRWIMLSNLYSQIDDNKNLLGLKVQWVRSHTIDHIEKPDSLKPYPGCGYKDLLDKCFGNKKADDMANEGLTKSINTFLRRISRDNNILSSLISSSAPQAQINKQRIIVDKACNVAAKNFHSSQVSKLLGVKYILSKNDKFIPEHIIRKIFDEKGLYLYNHFKREQQKNKIHHYPDLDIPDLDIPNQPKKTFCTKNINQLVRMRTLLLLHFMLPLLIQFQAMM